MDIGQLDHHIRIERKTQVQIGHGQIKDEWELVANAWVSLRPIKGQERLAAMQMRAELTHTVVVHYHPLLMPPMAAAQWRIVFGSRTMNILSARRLKERNEWIEFSCSEGGTSGH